MPFLQLGDSRFPLARGEVRVGAGQDVDVRLPSVGPRASATVAVVSVLHDGSSTIRLDGEGDLAVNGVPVGAHAVPLLHGDRLTIDATEFRIADENQLGETVSLPIAPDGPDWAEPSPGVTEATVGGRLLSLVDGREYAVGTAGLSIGRDAGCDIVIASREISRRHAVIRASTTGYELLDRSMNGVLVNGRRVRVTVGLGRGDTIRLGREEFRFYAETGVGAAVPGLARAPSLQDTAAIRAVKPPRGSGAPGPGKPTPVTALAAVQVPLTAPGPGRPVATLEVINEGPTKGMTFAIEGPLANIGRGEHNDIVIRDESVSEFHAKLQRRDDGWHVVDIDSTNGTYVNGRRVAGADRMAPGSDLRVGGIKMLFRPTDGEPRTVEETRVIVGVKGPEPRRVEPGRPDAKGRVTQPTDAVASPPAVPRRVTFPLWLAILLVIVIGSVIYLVLQGR